MAKAQKIEEGDTITIRVKVSADWPDGKITVVMPNGEKATFKPEWAEIVKVEKG